MSSKNGKSLLYRNTMLPETRYSILIFIFFIFKLFLYAQTRDSFSPDVTTYYVLSYDLGFIPRAFIGSVIALFTDYITKETFKIIAMIFTLIMLAMVSILIGKAIGKSSPEYKTSVIIFALLFLTAPLSISHLVIAYFGRLDTFWLFFTLVGLLCLKKPILKWTIPALCFAAVATHPGYLFTYMPALAIPLLYEVYRSKISKKSIFLFASSCFILITFFVYFQFFSVKVGFSSAEALGEYLSKRTDMKISIQILYLEFISTHSNVFFSEWWFNVLNSFALPTIISYIACTSPIIVIFGYIWKKSIKSSENNFQKFIFVLCALSPLAFIPAALFGQDWDRWWSAAISCQFLFIFYFIISDEVIIKDALKKIGSYFDSHTLILLCILAFSSSLMFSNLGILIFKIMDKDIYFDLFEKVLKDFHYLP